MSICLLCFIEVNAQTKADSVSFIPYTKENLTKMGKLSLTDLYIDQIEKVIRLAPNAVFTTSDDIPDNRYTRRRWRRINSAMYLNTKVISNNYKDIIPFADKNAIIDNIIYMQSILFYLSNK